MPSSCSFDGEKIAGALEALIGEEQVSEDYVRFRIDLYTAQLAVCDRLRRSSQATASDYPCDRERESIPRIDIRRVPFDAALGQSILNCVCSALDARGQSSEDLRGLCTAAGDDPDLLERLAFRAAHGPDEAFLQALAERLEVTGDSLLFFGRALAAPFVTQTVRRHSRPATTREARPLSGNCPWCGSCAGLAMLSRETGKRLLCCSLCGSTWEWSRIECAFCGSRAEIGMLTFGEADPDSISTCGACKAYLKTVDQRKLPAEQPVIPLAAAVRTMYLDMIAEDAGFARSLPYVAVR